MPIFLEPNQKFPVVLESDKDKPAEVRPTFYAASQTMRGQERVAEVLDMLSPDMDISTKELFDATCEVLGNVIVGWKNMGGMDYAPEKLRDVLSYHEARELLRLVAYNQHVNHEEKKS